MSDEPYLSAVRVFSAHLERYTEVFGYAGARERLGISTRMLRAWRLWRAAFSGDVDFNNPSQPEHRRALRNRPTSPHYTEYAILQTAMRVDLTGVP